MSITNDGAESAPVPCLRTRVHLTMQIGKLNHCIQNPHQTSCILLFTRFKQIKSDSRPLNLPWSSKSIQQQSLCVHHWQDHHVRLISSVLRFHAFRKIMFGLACDDRHQFLSKRCVIVRKNLRVLSGLGSLHTKIHRNFQGVEVPCPRHQ